MIPIHKVLLYEKTANFPLKRTPEPELMNDLAQVQDYVKIYEWGGSMSSLLLHHIKELSHMIRDGDTIVDLACGPGSLLLELAQLYPRCHFIGVDLSPLMLSHLKSQVDRLKLKNVDVLLSDIRTVKKSDIKNGADMVISTLALHHLPSDDDLKAVFENTPSLLKEGGGIYFFDFGLLKSENTINVLVDEVRRAALPLATQDYDASLKASFPLKTVFNLAADFLPKPLTLSQNPLCDFYYFLQTSARTECSAEVQKKIKQIWKSLSFEMKLEHILLRRLVSRQHFRHS